jgi:hypothetical protein
VPLFGFHLLLSFNKAGHANWTAPAMVSLLILSAADWIQRARESARVRAFLAAGLAFGLLFSVIILNTDMIRHLGIPFPYERDPGGRLRGWQTTAEAVEKVRDSLEKELGQPLFLIANGRAMASNVGFYLKAPRLEGPAHPPIYTPETQSIEDQFSLWPRYDEFIPLKPGQKPLDPLYTEEGGFNPFFGRSALFITDAQEETPPTAITGGFEQTILWSCLDIERMGQSLRQIRIFLCTNYSGRAL